MIITPSLLEKNAEDLFNQIKKLTPYFNTFQIDIADGIDVPNKTVQIDDIALFLQSFDKTQDKQFSNLAIQQSSFEFHLMVKDYEKEIKKLEKLKDIINIRDILIHAKLISNIEYRISNSFSIGLVLYPEDPVSLLTNNNYQLTINSIPYIQIMSCRVGFKGTPFIPESLDKIEQLRMLDYRNKISLDGGINNKTIPTIMSRKYKPDILCPDSYFTKTKNSEELSKAVKILCELSLSNKTDSTP